MLKKVSDLNKTIISFGLSNLVILVTNLLTGFLIMKFINPNEFGIYNKFLVIANYIVLLNFGIPILLQSELPGLLKINAASKVNKLVNSAYSYFLSILVPATFIVLVISIYFILQKKYLLFFCSLILVTNIWQNLFQNKFLKVLYRTGNEFKNLIKIQNTSSILSLFFSFVIIFWGVAGIFVRNFTYTIYNIYKLIKKSPLNFKIDFKNSKEVLKKGFAYFRVNIFFAYFPILVSSLSALIFNSTDFGLLSLYFLIITALKKLLVSIDKVLYIKISENYFLNISAKNILNNVFKNNVIPYMFLYIIAMIFVFIYIDDIMIFFPLYNNGISIIKLSFVLGFLLMFNFQNIFFDVFKKMTYKFYSILIKYIIFIVCFLCLNFLNLIIIELILVSLIISELSSILYNFLIIKYKFS
jgi:O-antigen/teichoic acid export membrane protein